MSDLTKKFESWLVASYGYYDCYESIMSDYEWDMLGRELSEKWDEWDHPDKNLVERDQMFSGFSIEYPDWVKERFARIV